MDGFNGDLFVYGRRKEKRKLRNIIYILINEYLFIDEIAGSDLVECFYFTFGNYYIYVLASAK